MVQIRENKQKHMTSHVVAMPLMRACYSAGTAHFGVIVLWRKEAAP